MKIRNSLIGICNDADNSKREMDKEYNTLDANDKGIHSEIENTVKNEET